jgi:membrane protein YdbS with pleckstrin-like domain
MRDITYQQAEVVSVKEWLITIVVMLIPIVNIVMMFVWAYGKNTHPSKANFFKAQLIMMAVFFVLGLVLAITMPQRGY